MLKFEDEINLIVTDVDKYKGVILLNDSILLHQTLKRINIDEPVNRYSQIGRINRPYHILKKQNSDSIIIIKDSETLIYKLNNPQSHWLKELFKPQ